MMYSRRFAERQDLPPDYGGVALRKNTLEQEGSQRDPTPDARPKETVSQNEDRYFDDFAGKDASFSEKRGDRRAKRGPGENFHRPRRPLYERARAPKKGRSPSFEREGGKGRGQSEPKGLLSSLFSLSGKSFTMEDVILAGLILLLLGERENGEKIDGELLFALTFLLLGGR
jgi:hypothetical protein